MRVFRRSGILPLRFSLDSDSNPRIEGVLERKSGRAKAFTRWGYIRVITVDRLVDSRGGGTAPAGAGIARELPKPPKNIAS